MTSVGLGFFPLDQQLELWEKHWSEGLVKQAVWLSGTVASFEQAEETLARIGHISIIVNLSTYVNFLRIEFAKLGLRR